ncbi:hypothetical protein LCGC14_1969150 [marine sediment metagenome]|uniref:DNA methylase N-4/N-6 domain-containing protein n=1 Tax=marine sediment metagenome TaxID=412755 RepID=A0A0F9G0J0_9ZZZZ
MCYIIEYESNINKGVNKMTKQFAPTYDRTDEGWVMFPSDQGYRKEMFPAEVNSHVAKANVFLVQSIIEYVSEIDQTVMDIMSGTGTIIVAALIGRKVMCIEISEYFAGLIHKAIDKLDIIAPGLKEQITVINAPCQQILPLPGVADHIIFSPPYSNIMKKGDATDKLTMEKMKGAKFQEYSQHPLNLGTMNDFIWGHEMEKVYAKCYETIKPGGTLSIIVKDHMEKNNDTGDRDRIQLSMSAYNACERVGFVEKDWLKWKAPGSVYTHIYRAKGWEVVDDEDIIVMQKPVAPVVDYDKMAEWGRVTPVAVGV